MGEEVKRLRVKAILVAFLVSPSIYAQNLTPLNLKGISQISVQIQLLDGGGTGSCSENSLAKSFGLTERDVRTETELRLRQAGFTVAATGPALYVIITGCVLPEFGIGIVTAEVSLWESGTVERQKKPVSGPVTGWRTSNYKIVSIADSAITAKSTALIQGLVSSFLNDWMAEK